MTVAEVLAVLKRKAKGLRRETVYEEISAEDLYGFQYLIRDLVMAMGNPWENPEEHDLLFSLGEILAARQNVLIEPDQLACYLTGVYAIGKAVGREEGSQNEG